MREVCLQFPSAWSTTISYVTVCPCQGIVSPPPPPTASAEVGAVTLSLRLSLSQSTFPCWFSPCLWVLHKPPSPALSKHWVSPRVQLVTSSLLSLYSACVPKGS